MRRGLLGAILILAAALAYLGHYLEAKTWTEASLLEVSQARVAQERAQGHSDVYLRVRSGTGSETGRGLEFEGLVPEAQHRGLAPYPDDPTFPAWYESSEWKRASDSLFARKRETERAEWNLAAGSRFRVVRGRVLLFGAAGVAGVGLLLIAFGGARRESAP